MKLHRICCSNLNSLYGEQVVDLDAHLAGAPLFLIHGPTGSGKSSLMDAVSLALFGKTPRLGNEHGKDDTDPRTVMSWGTGECFAEVEFSKLATDGTRQRYRARWTCWRARKQVEGVLQYAERSLEVRQADGEWHVLYSGNQVKPAERAFDGALEGFGVADFQRSMLLAQGQFDALLSAETRDRAAILERLTRTESYQKIGARAARLAKAYKDRIDTLEAAWRHVGAVDPAMLAAKEQEEADRRREAGERKAALTALQGFQRWIAERDRIAGDVEGARLAQEALVPRRAGLSADLAALSEHERRLPAFVILDAIRGCEGTIAGCEADITMLEPVLAGLDAEVTIAEGVRDQARARREEAARLCDTLKAAATASRAALDGQATAEGEASKAAGLVTKARKVVDEAVEGEAKAVKEFGEAESRVTCAQQARDTHAHLESLAHDWDALHGRLDDVLRRDGEISKEAKRIAKDDEALERDRKAADEAGQALAAFEAASVAPVRQALADATGALAALLGSDSLEARRAALILERERADVRITALERLKRALQQVAATRSKVETRTKDRNAAGAAVTAAEAAVATAEAEARARTDETEALREAHEGLVRVAAVAVHRASLADGSPCPLCGATKHPWADDPSRAPDDEQIAAEEERSKKALAAAENRATQAESAAGKAREQSSGAQEGLKHAESELQTAADEATAAVAERNAALPAAGLPTDADVPECDDAIVAETLRRDGAASRFNAIETADSKVRTCATEAQSQEAELRKRAHAVETKRVEIETRGSGLADDRRRHEEARTTLGADTAALQADLRGHALDLPTESPADWTRVAKAAVDTWNAVVAEVASATGDLPVAKTKLEAARAAVSLRQGALQAATDDHAVRAANVKEAAATSTIAREALLTAWRLALAADQPDDHRERPGEDSTPENLVSSQVAVVEALEAALTAAGAALETRRTEAGEARGKLAQRRTDLDAARVKLEEQRATLRAEAARLAIEDVASLESVRLSPERHDELSLARRNLEDDERDARTRLEERSSALAGVLERRPEDLPEDATPESLTESVTQAETDANQAADALEEARTKVMLLQEQERQGRDARHAWEELLVLGTMPTLPSGPLSLRPG